jgi:hypothetical protein
MIMSDESRDDEYRRKLSIEQRKRAHEAIDQWFDEVEREQPDLESGEQATLTFRAGYGGGYMSLTHARTLEKEL